jgi:hypothetical protein
MVKLTDLGFNKDVIYESIASTFNPDETPNAAPMGIKMQDETHLSLDIFNTSSTLRNMKTKKYAVINLTSDIDAFYKSAFKEANPGKKVPHEWFVKSDFVEAPKLRFADAAVETAVSCRVEHVTSTAKYPQVYSRATALTLEAIIHATRVEVYLNSPQKQKETANLIEKIQDCAGVVERVAPNSIYTAVLADLLKRIGSWRHKP